MKVKGTTHWKKPENSVLGEGGLPSRASRRSIVDRRVNESVGRATLATATSKLQLAERTDVELANERVYIRMAEEARENGEEIWRGMSEREGRSLAIPPDDLRVLWVIEKVCKLRAR